MTWSNNGHDDANLDECDCVDMVMRAVAIVRKPVLDAITQSAEIDYN